MTILTRKEAIALSLKTYFTGKPCKFGHKDERRVDNRSCTECGRADALQRASVNPELSRAKNIAWHSANIEKVRARKANRYAMNCNRERANAAKYRAANPDKYRASVKKWRAANPEKVNTNSARRRALKRSAIPAGFGDFDQFVLQEAYAACKRREVMTGYKWQVDHMIPLNRGGKHTWRNIQVLPAKMNLNKKDKLLYTLRMAWIRELPGAMK